MTGIRGWPLVDFIWTIVQMTKTVCRIVVITKNNVIRTFSTNGTERNRELVDVKEEQEWR